MTINPEDRITVTIVTITYKDREGVINTVQSIDKNLSQKYFGINHLIINGNTQDNTDEYINELKTNRDINTILVSEEDEGIYDAMNKGIKNATGDFIIFINSGDLIINNFDNIDIYNFLTIQKAEEGIAGVAFGCNYKIFNKYFKITPREVSKYLPKMPTIHQGILYKRKILNDIQYALNYKICGDFEHICRIIKNYKFANYDFFISELVAGGISSNKPFLLFKESRAIYQDYFKPSIFYKYLYDIRLLKSMLQFQILYQFLSFHKKFK